MTQYESGLYSQLAAEIAAFPSVGLFRGQLIYGIKGISPQTQSLRAAGYYDKQEIDFTILTPTGAAIQTTEQLTLGGVKYRVREFETMEADHGVKLVLSRLT